jgi:hypothetical protein
LANDFSLSTLLAWFIFVAVGPHDHQDVSTGGYAAAMSRHHRPAPKCVAQSQSTAGNASDHTTNEKRAVSVSLRHKPINLRNCARLSVDRNSKNIVFSTSGQNMHGGYGDISRPEWGFSAPNDDERATRHFQLGRKRSSTTIAKNGVIKMFCSNAQWLKRRELQVTTKLAVAAVTVSMAWFPAFAETGASQSQTSTTSANADDSLDEVIVTADRQPEKIQDVGAKYLDVAGIEKDFEYDGLSYSLIYTARYSGERFFALVNQQVVEGSIDVSVEEAFDD